MRNAEKYLKDHALPGKALELLDAAAAAVKVRLEEDKSIPDELRACRANLKSIENRISDAIANHEFEKARFYSEEEKKAGERLAELEKEYGVKNQPAPAVVGSDVEQIIAKWNAYPYAG